MLRLTDREITTAGKDRDGIERTEIQNLADILEITALVSGRIDWPRQQRSLPGTELATLVATEVQDWANDVCKDYGDLANYWESAECQVMDVPSYDVARKLADNVLKILGN